MGRSSAAAAALAAALVAGSASARLQGGLHDAWAAPAEPRRSTGAIFGDVNWTVRPDGSGNFTSVQAALDYAAPGSNPDLGTVTLRILGERAVGTGSGAGGVVARRECRSRHRGPLSHSRSTAPAAAPSPPPAGHFFERVHVYSNFSRGVVFIGDGPTAPGALLPGLANFIEYNVSGNSGPGTFGSWTVKVDAPNVTFVNVAVANSADGYDHKVAGQSVALHLTADEFACWGCSLLGGQDTLYTGEAGCRSYFSGAYINGSCDALFGGSSSVFAGSRIDMSFTVTAHRGNGSTAYLVLDSEVTSPSTVLLGRPWGEQARVVFKSCYMRGVEKAGWDDWGHNCTSKHSSWCNTTYFAEVRGGEAGAGTAGRKARQLCAALTMAHATTALAPYDLTLSSHL